MTEIRTHPRGLLLLVVGSAVLLLPPTIIIALVSLPLPGGITIALAAAAAHASLWKLGRAPTAALLLITAATAVQAVVTGLFVLLPSTLLVLVGLHAAASRGDRRAAVVVGVVGPLAATARYAVDPSVTRSPFGPAPWLMAILLFAVCTVAITLGLLRRSELRAASLDEARREGEERSRVHRDEAAAAAERARISRELHDVLAHSLTAIVGQTRVARFAPGDAVDALDVIEETARDSLNDLRATLRMLRDGEPGAGTHPATTLTDLDALSTRMQALGLDVRRRTTGTPRGLGPATALALHRFAQEGLTNALRYGDGTLDWEERWGENRLVIILRNAVPSVPRDAVGSGLGLRGMRERLDAVGGTVAIDVANGFTVTASVPFSFSVSDGRASSGRGAS
ncbi:sensor histidine kinase [Promicromonospora sukumoe]|uniref:sensor histidine kinase n=1 Tax=Promicromonospora sukumoe TaxID=88382 RepID=UPI0037CBB8A3